MQNTILSGENHLEKPCLVETSQGFSVSYKNRFLYSKYSPKRAIIQTIESMTFLPNSLILCVSPVLWHGLLELKQKLPENCFILGIETDKNLFELSKSELEKIKHSEKINAEILPIEEIRNIVEIISGKRKIKINFPKTCDLKRAIMIEMSAGSAFDKDFYREIANASQNAIASFWKNRITLIKLGRLFSKNLLKNLPELKDSIAIQNFFGKIEKPILIFGGGEGTGLLLSRFTKEDFEKFFVLAVDAVIPTLHSLNIKIDGIICVEAQLAIEKAYIGGSAKNSIIFADISSRNQVLKHTQNEVSFFASEFCDANFFRNISKEDFFPPVIPPLGSVGLTATYIALLLRKNTEIPVFVAGLDFSFSLGTTHTKGTPATIHRLSTSNRFNPYENYDSAFKMSSQKLIGKNGKEIFTDIALMGYAENFKSVFKNQKNLFDVGESGIFLELPLVNSATFKNFIFNLKKTEISLQLPKGNEKTTKKILNYLESEEKSLERAKELLIFGKDVERCGSTVEKELQEILSNREYLFLHFPDGFRFDVTNLSLLKRIRTEIDFFLKTLKNGITLLSL